MISRWIFILVMLIRLTYGNFNLSQVDCTQLAAPVNSELTSHYWLRGESQAYAAIIQLFSVFSYVPTAMIMKSNLIVHDMYSGGVVKIILQYVLNHPMPYFHIGKRKRVPFPFEGFFNFTHFQHYWKNNASPYPPLHIVSAREYDECYPSSPKVKAFISAPEPATLSMGSNELRKESKSHLFTSIDWKQTKAANPTIQDFSVLKKPTDLSQHTVFHLTGGQQFRGIYNYIGHSDLLLKVVESLQPADSIANLLDPIINSILPPDFITVIVRLDLDYEEENQQLLTVPDKESRLQLLLNSFQEHDCTRDALMNGFTDLPTLFLLTKEPVQTKIEKKRMTFLIDQLKKLGFSRIETKKTLLEKVYQHYLQQSLSNTALSFQKIHEMITEKYFQLTFEQLSFLETMIAVQSHCFIPSVVSSPRSYWIQRLIPFYQHPQNRYHRKGKTKNPFHGKIIDQLDEISETKYGPSVTFRAWGL